MFRKNSRAMLTMKVYGPFYRKNKRIIVYKSVNCMAREIKYSISMYLSLNEINLYVEVFICFL